MPDTTSSSLADIIQAAQTVPAAQSDTAATPPSASASAAPPADSSAIAADDTPPVTTDDSGSQVDDATATTPSDAGAAETTPATIDWGAAMPALAARAQQLLGEEAGVLTKYSDIDGLIRSIAEREKQVGQQSTYVGAFNQLAQAGVTVQDLQALMASKRGGATAAPGTNGNGQPSPAWSKNFLAGRDAEGKPIFNRAELARHGLTEAQAAQAFTAWQDQLADIFSGPEGVQQLIASVVDPRLGYAAQQTKQELTAAQQAQQARIAEEAAASSWANANASLLYLNKKDPNGGVTPFYQQMEAYMKQLNPAMPWAQQLEVSKNAVLAMNRPAAAAPTPSEKAKRQPGTSSNAVKLSPTEFHKKYSDRYADPSGLGLAEWLNYETTGKVPEVARR